HAAAHASEQHLQPHHELRQQARAIGEHAEHDEQRDGEQRERAEGVIEAAHQDRRLHVLEEQDPGAAREPHAEGHRHADEQRGEEDDREDAEDHVVALTDAGSDASTRCGSRHSTTKRTTMWYVSSAKPTGTANTNHATLMPRPASFWGIAGPT